MGAWIPVSVPCVAIPGIMNNTERSLVRWELKWCEVGGNALKHRIGPIKVRMPWSRTPRNQGIENYWKSPETGKLDDTVLDIKIHEAQKLVIKTAAWPTSKSHSQIELDRRSKERIVFCHTTVKSLSSSSRISHSERSWRYTGATTRWLPLKRLDAVGSGSNQTAGYFQTVTS